MSKRNYALDAGQSGKRIAAPELAYRPRPPRDRSTPIGLIGTGGIAIQHLTAYRDAGLNVVAVANRTVAKAKKLARRFFPQAALYSDYREVLARPDIAVVDITTPPDIRAGMIEAALRAGKHVLSQKPFVTDLRVGRRLADLAENRCLKLAVNQNGRWAPHFSWLRHAVQRGLVGDVLSVDLSVHWDHDWIARTTFNEVHHIVLFDFGVHWFDALQSFMTGRPARNVFATLATAAGQKSKPPLLGQAMVQYDAAQASIVFNAATKQGKWDRSVIVGTKGTLRSEGPDLATQTVTLHTKRGVAQPKLAGTWFPGGFAGTMFELLRAIEQGKEPENSARKNLSSLALSFAACRSAETGRPQVPGKVQSVKT